MSYSIIELKTSFKRLLKKCFMRIYGSLREFVNVFCFLNWGINESSFNINEFSPLEFGFFHLEKIKLGNYLESTEYLKIQELTFLPEYYLISVLFCVTLFFLFTLKQAVTDKSFSIKFQYANQLLFLFIFGLVCYLILVMQQMNVSLLALNSFNDTICNDQLSLISKFIIGVSSILYLIFISKYLSSQKLNNFEYYIILLTSIFGFFLLCGANDLITAYLAIELQGLAFYVLASFKKSSNFSVESGVKYFVLGSLSTAIFLLGTIFIYKVSTSVVLSDFKDFFVWVFTANSFFLSFESILKALEVFQEDPYFLKLEPIELFEPALVGEENSLNGSLKKMEVYYTVGANFYPDIQKMNAVAREALSDCRVREDTWEDGDYFDIEDFSIAFMDSFNIRLHMDDTYSAPTSGAEAEAHIATALEKAEDNLRSEGFTSRTTKRLPSIADVKHVAIHGVENSNSIHAQMLKEYYYPHVFVPEEYLQDSLRGYARWSKRKLVAANASPEVVSDTLEGIKRASQTQLGVILELEE